MEDWPSTTRWVGASRLDQLPCWVYFDEATRQRLYEAAQRCLLSGTRLPLDFLGEAGWPTWASAEFSALLNTVERAPGDLLNVEDSLWQRWSTLAVWYVFGGTEEQDRDFRGFFTQRPQPFLDAVGRIFNSYIPRNRGSSIAEGLSFDWTPEIARFVLEQTRTIALPNSSWDTLAKVGLEESPQLFKEYLWEEFSRLCTFSGEGRDARLITVVALLLRHAKAGTWTALKNLILAEPLIGQEAIVRGAEVFEGNSWLQNLDDEEIAGLYVWISRQFPANIGELEGAGFVGSTLTIRMLRESALVNLRSRGNLKVFRSVLKALPHVAWLPMQMAYVQEAHFHNRWRVETPEGLLDMAAENGVPWYQKKQIQVILLIVSFLGLALGIASLITADGAWRSVALIVCSVLFIFLAGWAIHIRTLDSKANL